MIESIDPEIADGQACEAPVLDLREPFFAARLCCVRASAWPHSQFAGHMPGDGDLPDPRTRRMCDAERRTRKLAGNPAQRHGFP
jgi:hypothetical protein